MMGALADFRAIDQDRRDDVRSRDPARSDRVCDRLASTKTHFPYAGPELKPGAGFRLLCALSDCSGICHKLGLLGSSHPARAVGWI